MDLSSLQSVGIINLLLHIVTYNRWSFVISALSLMDNGMIIVSMLLICYIWINILPNHRKVVQPSNQRVITQSLVCLWLGPLWRRGSVNRAHAQHFFKLLTHSCPTVHIFFNWITMHSFFLMRECVKAAPKPFISHIRVPVSNDAVKSNAARLKHMQMFVEHCTVLQLSVFQAAYFVHAPCEDCISFVFTSRKDLMWK